MSARAPGPSPSRATFSDRIVGTLDLVIGGESFSFPAGSLERIWIKATTYDFEAEVVFGVVCDGVPDTVFSSFITTDLITATLTLANGNEGYADEDSPPWKLQGPVTWRRLLETTADDKTGIPIVLRRYSIRFLDPARVFWGQHRPLELLTSASMKDVLTAYVAPGMQLDASWNALDESMDMLCIGAGSEGPATFYDLVIWFVYEHHGILELDAEKAKYKFAAAKSKSKQKLMVDPDIVQHLRTRPSEPLRRAASVLNAYSEAATRKKSITNSNAVTGVRRDALLRSPIQTEMDRRVRVETARLDAGPAGIDLTFHRLPPAFAPPNTNVSLGEEFSAALFPAGKTYRVYEVELDARIDAPVDVGDPDDDSAVFHLTYRLSAEQENDPRPRLPAFHRPQYPIIVEGKVLAASGGDDDRTWTAQENEMDALHAYRVNIPLWNKIVKTPFVPDYQPGHFFFPAYKHQRVLVALFFNRAEIVGYLDWAGRLAQTTQGDQIILGKRDKDETVARHVYEEAKPKLTIVRKLAGDTQTITVSEGVIRFVVEELEEAPAPEPKYDVTPKVDAAVDEVGAEVRSSIAKISGTFESSMGSATASLEAATAEVEGELSASAATIGAKIAAAEGELQTMMSSATEAIVEATAMVDEAKAALVQALYA
ncbi:MAG: hypothetical protein IPM54_37565 [Polyangiaceae bacterium]|nr:hypothetical protein [Polyangiaceae bacterium]